MDILRTSGWKLHSRKSETLDKQACRCGHPWPEGVDVHDPKGFSKNFGRLNFRSLKDSTEFVSALAVFIAYSVIIAGHLPLVMPLIWLGILSTKLVAAISRYVRERQRGVQNVLFPSEGGVHIVLPIPPLKGPNLKKQSVPSAAKIIAKNLFTKLIFRGN